MIYFFASAFESFNYLNHVERRHGQRSDVSELIYIGILSTKMAQSSGKLYPLQPRRYWDIDFRHCASVKTHRC